MNTEITTRHFDLSESLKQRTEDRLNKLNRYFDRIMDARVVVSLEGNRFWILGLLPRISDLISRLAAARNQLLDKLDAIATLAGSHPMQRSEA